MNDTSRITQFINEVNQKCDKILTKQQQVGVAYKREQSISASEAERLVAQMQSAFAKYCEDNFTTLYNRLRDIIKLLAKNYEEETNAVKCDGTEIQGKSSEECKVMLVDCIQKLNACISSLNALDFETLVPPVFVELDGESFRTYTGNGEDARTYNYDSTVEVEQNAKPAVELVVNAVRLCKKGMTCVARIKELYAAEIDIAGYERFVKDAKRAWDAERKSQIDNEFEAARFNLFDSAATQDWVEQFFDALYEPAKRATVDYKTGTMTDHEQIVLGSASVEVTKDPGYMKVIAESEALKKRITNGKIHTPVMLNMRKCGNILLKVKQPEKYDEQIKQFLDQTILKFLLAFPAKRLKMRLIDIASKVDFSPYTKLTKVDKEILFDGIVRDERKLADVIKDMKELMYSVSDKKVTMNDVDDVFAYNQSFESTPQDFHLLVLTDFPNGISENLAEDILQIVENGRRSGIFTVIVHNEAVEFDDPKKEYAFDKIANNIQKCSMCIHYNRGTFKMDTDLKHTFEPDKTLSTALLSEITEVMARNVEQVKQKSVPLGAMFEATDRAEQSVDGIKLAADVLDIPIGVQGGDVQTLKLETNNGSPHTAILGGTGSGKSVLLHTIILNTCYKYSPEDVNLYLLDFKGGTEFKFYEANKDKKKQLPHIKLLGITRNVEDGIAMLSNLRNVMYEREKLFKANGAEDIVTYCRAGNKLPRLFVLIDEIQELFGRDDKITQKALSILGDLFSQGRSFGINLLWASQSVPVVPGLENNVLNHIGNKISLQLNNPDNATKLGIDAKAVSALNRPEKGLGVIVDKRTGSGYAEFRVAYSEKGEKRQVFVQQILDKWQAIEADHEAMFVFGSDEPPTPAEKGSVFAVLPNRAHIASKAFGSYTVQFGQNYITGKPFSMHVDLRTNKSNVAIIGTNLEVIRDMMGYSLLSIAMEHTTNADCMGEPTKIYYANREGESPELAKQLLNVARQDFSHIVENVTSPGLFKDAVVELYKLYTQRRDAAERAQEATPYSPSFFVIHSLQRYIDLFDGNAKLTLNENAVEEQDMGYSAGCGNVGEFNPFAQANSSSYTTMHTGNSVSFVDAFKELLSRAGQFGIHFIISLDNPNTISCLRDELSGVQYKVLTKGVNGEAVAQLLGGYGHSDLNNPEIALVAEQGEKYKVRMYRYDAQRDGRWYQPLVQKYLELR